MADIARIKRNAKRMADQGAPENEIDDYVKTEGATFEQLKAFKGFGSVSDEATRRLAQDPGGGLGLRLADNLSLGAFTPVSAAAKAGVRQVGRVLTGQETDYTDAYKRERDTQDEMLRRSREDAGWLGVGTELGLSLPFMAGQAGTQAAGQARNALSRWVLDPAKAGAAYGAAYGFNSARGGVGEHIENTATHGLTGAVLGPVLNAGANALAQLPAPLARAYGWATGRSPQNRAAVERHAQEMADAGIREFGPIMTDSGAGRFASQSLARSAVGAPMRNAAQGAIDDVSTAARRALSEHTGGAPVNDLGAGIKQDLRYNLAEHSIPGTQIARMTPEQHAPITGPIDGQGFAPPPPTVEPIKPAPFKPVMPEAINEANVPFDIVQPRQTARGEVRPEYPTREQFQPHPDALRAADVSQREAIAARHAQTQAYQEFDALAKRFGVSPEQMWQTVGNPMPAARNYYGEQAVKAFDALNASNVRLQHAELAAKAASKAADDSHHEIWTDAVRKAHHRATNDVEAAYARDTAQATREATEATQANRRRAISEAEAQARAKAEAHNARLRKDAEDAAAAATERARFEAQAKYDSERQSSPVFQSGRSRETYPTEYASAYEQAARLTPQYRINPMGGPTAEGRAAKTATRDIVSELADEGHRRLHIKGKPFEEDGSVSQELAAYLKDRLGGEIGHRLTELSKARPGHNATSPHGLKELRSEIRDAAQRAESPPYPEMPRKAEAAMLRRLHGALTEDMDRFARQSGGPAPRFTTETQIGEYVGQGRTKIGDMPPSDMTIYVKPEHLDRLTGSRMPNDHTGTLPATRQLKVEKDTLVVQRNDVGDVNAMTRVPFSTKPEVGLRPVQLWSDGSRVHYGSPITSRSASPGEHAADIMRGLDRSYGQDLEKLRQPLGRLFGDRVEPIQAMDDLVKAAKDGNLDLLRPFVRVMTEKSNPTKAGAAIITHAASNAKTMGEFFKAYRSLRPESLDVVLGSAEGRALRTQLDRLEKWGAKLEPFESAIADVSGRLDRGKLGGLNLGHAALPYLMWTHAFPVAGYYFGKHMAARFMASPRYVAWLNRSFEMRSPGALNTHIDRLAFIAGNDPELRKEMPGFAKELKKKIAEGAIPSANAAPTLGTSKSAPSATPDPTELDKMADMVGKAASGRGIDLGKASPQEVIDSAWDASPSDAMADAIEQMAKRHGLKLPWDK